MPIQQIVIVTEIWFIRLMTNRPTWIIYDLLLSKLFSHRRTRTWMYTVCTLCLTFYNFLRVIQEEFAEWWSFGSFQCVQQLLNLSGHPAIDRHAWTNTKNSDCHKHMQTNNPKTHAHPHMQLYSNTNLYNLYFITHSHALAHSQDQSHQQEGFEKGNLYLKRHRLDL